MAHPFHARDEAVLGVGEGHTAFTVVNATTRGKRQDILPDYKEVPKVRLNLYYRERSSDI